MRCWSPIESAPSTGYVIGAWRDGSRWLSAQMWFDDSVDEWTDVISDRYLRPSHWAPLPDTTADLFPNGFPRIPWG